jgi:hypothetical protein
MAWKYPEQSKLDKRFRRAIAKEQGLCAYLCGRKAKAGWKICSFCRLYAVCKRSRK